LQRALALHKPWHGTAHRLDGARCHFLGLLTNVEKVEVILDLIAEAG
jgi:hypothetical protein